MSYKINPQKITKPEKEDMFLKIIKQNTREVEVKKIKNYDELINFIENELELLGIVDPKKTAQVISKDGTPTASSVFKPIKFNTDTSGILHYSLRELLEENMGVVTNIIVVKEDKSLIIPIKTVSELQIKFFLALEKRVKFLLARDLQTKYKEFYDMYIEIDKKKHLDMTKKHAKFAGVEYITPSNEDIINETFKGILSYKSVEESIIIADTVDKKNFELSKLNNKVYKQYPKERYAGYTHFVKYVGEEDEKKPIKSKVFLSRKSKKNEKMYEAYYQITKRSDLLKLDRKKSLVYGEEKITLRIILDPKKLGFMLTCYADNLFFVLTSGADYKITEYEPIATNTTVFVGNNNENIDNLINEELPDDDDNNNINENNKVNEIESKTKSIIQPEKKKTAYDFYLENTEKEQQKDNESKESEEKIIKETQVVEQKEEDPKVGGQKEETNKKKRQLETINTKNTDESKNYKKSKKEKKEKKK